MKPQNKSMLKKGGINLIGIIFILTLFTAPFILAATNYGEGAYGSGIYGQVYCGDNVCDASESCSSCSDDCGTCSVSESGGRIIERNYIEKTHLWTEIIPEIEAVVYGFDEDFGVNKIEIKVSEINNNVRLIVRKYHEKPNIPKAPGIVYKYLQIESENLEFLEKAVINSKVEKTWIFENEIENISLYKFNESSLEWNRLDTNLTNESDDFNFYKTELNSFSYFAILGGSLIPISEIPEVPGEELISEEAPKQNTILLWTILGLILSVVLISSLVVLLIKIRKKREFERFVEKQREDYIDDYMNVYNELGEIVKRHESGYEEEYFDIYSGLKERYERRKKVIEEYERNQNNLKVPLTILLIISILFGIFIGTILIQDDFSLTGFVAEGRLPTVGGDSGNWGTVLNNFLSQEHTQNGSHKNISVAGYLNVSGDVNISGSLDIDKNLTVGNANVTGNLSVDDNLNVTGNVGIKGNLTIDGDASVIGNLTLGDKITFRLGEVIDNLVDSWIQITGNLNVTNNLTVNENAKFEKNVNVSGNLSVLGTVNASNLRAFDLIRNDAPDASTTSATYVNLASSSSTNFNGRPTLFLLSVSAYDNIGTDENWIADFGINIDGGTSTSIVELSANKISDHRAVSSWIILTPSSGSHTINIVWKRNLGAGTITIDTEDHIHLTAIEL